MTSGEKIGILAKKKQIPLKRVAEKAGIAYSTLYSMVTRKSNRIDTETLQKISDALGCSSVWDLVPTTTFEEFYSGVKIPEFDEAGRRLSEWTLSSLNDGTAKIKTSDEAMNFLKAYLEANGKDQQTIEKLGYITLNMNEKGKKRVVENAEDFAKIPEYQKKDSEK